MQGNDYELTETHVSIYHGYTNFVKWGTISIIALLISLLLPALTQAHEAAYTAVCAGNQKQYGMAFFMYSEDRDGAFP